MLEEKSFNSVQVLSVNYEALLCTLRLAASAIKEEFPDCEVYLFGSFAKRNYTPLSDVDILIIVRQTDKPYLQRKEQFSAYFTLPFDANILVYTREEISNMQDSGNQLIINIMQEAREL
jgi:predicted nucleotidyltransferase